MALTGKEVSQMHAQYIAQSWSKSGGAARPIKSGKGIYLYDYDGNEIADTRSLLVCANLGHSLPEMVEAIKAQAVAELENEYNIHTYGRENTISICPPLIITEEQLVAVLPKFDEVLTWIDEQLPTLEKDANYTTAVACFRK